MFRPPATVEVLTGAANTMLAAAEDLARDRRREIEIASEVLKPLYWQLDPAAVEGFLTQRCRRVSGAMVDTTTGRAVTAICPVHLLGHPAPG
ncbi:hypothetical protein [Actinomadura rudentiformis]|uniref:Uncharacterized protein n=1 Tax=Actinomadura rudentiformis TaxID=359158 RepID=A0A6H9YYY2_9ACTN|nr:hypothetical protein [Actinomadura rudentiformis]KAB2352594.1 hypothetical protein F8566_02735 [Actinomadura rudentiformis]